LCQQYGRETLADFLCKFLCLKAQAPEVSDEQGITQAFKVLCTSQLHSHLVRDCPKTLEGLYEEFWKFIKAEVLHFCKLGQQRKVATENKSWRPFEYSKGKDGTPNFDAPHKQAIASTRMDVDLHKIGTKISSLCGKKAREKHMTPGEIISKPEVAIQAKAEAGAKIMDLFIPCSTWKTPTIAQGDCPIFLVTKKKITQKHNQPSTTPISKEVSHTSH
jgi:hypothetical protein